MSGCRCQGTGARRSGCPFFTDAGCTPPEEDPSQPSWWVANPDALLRAVQKDLRELAQRIDEESWYQALEARARALSEFFGPRDRVTMSFHTVGELRRALVGLSDDQVLHCQVIAKDGSAWNLWGSVSQVGETAVLTLTHDELDSLPTFWAGRMNECLRCQWKGPEATCPNCLCYAPSSMQRAP